MQRPGPSPTPRPNYDIKPHAASWLCGDSREGRRVGVTVLPLRTRAYIMAFIQVLNQKNPTLPTRFDQRVRPGPGLCAYVAPAIFGSRFHFIMAFQDLKFLSTRPEWFKLLSFQISSPPLGTPSRACYQSGGTTVGSGSETK